MIGADRSPLSSTYGFTSDYATDDIEFRLDQWTVYVLRRTSRLALDRMCAWSETGAVGAVLCTCANK